jgi:hypothetical protein
MEHKTSSPTLRPRTTSQSKLPSQTGVPRQRSLSLSKLLPPPPSSPRKFISRRLSTISELVSPRVVENTPVFSHRLTTIISEVGVNLDKVQQHSTESEWAEIVEAAKDVIGGEPVELKVGSKLPELLLRAVQKAEYGDLAACRVICLFHPSDRPEALLLLTSRLASGPKPAPGELQKSRTGRRQ